MPSPDVRQYVNLAVLDRTVQQIAALALADAAVKLPGWTPREGNTETVLLEALALEVAELVYAINRLPAAVTEILLRLFDLERSPGARPTVDLRFDLADTLGHTIPAGTRVRLVLPAGIPAIEFATAAALVVNAAADTGVVAAVGSRLTAAANGVPAATAVDLLDAVAYVETVTLETDVTGGADPETGGDFLNRGMQRLRRLNDTLATPDNFTAAALERPDLGVYRALTLDNWDGAGGAPGDDPGHVTVAAVGPLGVLLTAPNKAALEAALEAPALANLDVHVVDPTLTAVTVTVEVVRLDGYTDPDVTANIEAALTAYLSTDTWEWSATVRRFELIALVDRVAGVDYVTTLLVNAAAADLALAGQANLATSGAHVVTTLP